MSTRVLLNTKRMNMLYISGWSKIAVFGFAERMTHCHRQSAVRRLPSIWQLKVKGNVLQLIYNLAQSAYQ